MENLFLLTLMKRYRQVPQCPKHELHKLHGLSRLHGLHRFDLNNNDIFNNSTH